jgi:hypothetical protein
MAKYLFCEGNIKYYAFVCPDGGAVACNPCKIGLGRFVMPGEIEDEQRGDGGVDEMEDGGKVKEDDGS